MKAIRVFFENGRLVASIHSPNGGETQEIVDGSRAMLRKALQSLRTLTMKHPDRAYTVKLYRGAAVLLQYEFNSEHNLRDGDRLVEDIIRSTRAHV